MIDWLNIATAGIGPLVVAYGISTALIIGCLVAAYFSPILKKDFIWAAVVLAAINITFTVGVHQGEKRVQAQWDAARTVTTNKTKAARAGAVRDVARKPSRWLPTHRDPDLRD